MHAKQIFILTFISLAALSCARISVDTVPQEEPIGFSWYTPRPTTTKADTELFVDGHDLSEGTSMGVFGYFHPLYEDGGGTTQHGSWEDGVNVNRPNLFYNEQVTVGTPDYTYDHSRYWPGNVNDRISFIAYYPYSDNVSRTGEDTGTDTECSVEPFLDSDGSNNGLVGFKYTVPEDVSEHVDFMVSDLCMDQSKALWKESNGTQGLTGPENGKVKFYFHHALSQVRIESVTTSTVNNDNLTVDVRSIRFNGVAVRARCIPVPAAAHAENDTDTGHKHVNLTWSQHSCYRTSSDVEEASIVTDRTGDDPEDVLLMIPQSFPADGDAEIEVTFDITRWKDKNNKVYLADGTTPDPAYYEYRYADNVLSAPLHSDDLDEWLPGKIYTYRISLTLHAIRVQAVSVTDWETGIEDVFPHPITDEP